MQGYVIRRSDTDYVINCDAHGNGGYNVVPLEVDPWNKYTIEEVEAYLQDNPAMLLDYTALQEEESIRIEIASLKTYLSYTDYIYPKCQELDLDVTYMYSDTIAERKATRIRIQELEV